MAGATCKDSKVLALLPQVQQHTVTRTHATARAGKKARAKQQEAPMDARPTDKRGKQKPPPPPSYPDVAICNATGVLHHMTFMDEAKLQVGAVHGAVWVHHARCGCTGRGGRRARSVACTSPAPALPRGLTLARPARARACLQVGQQGGVPILAMCLKTSNIQTKENATGALWNMGLDLHNTSSLQQAGLPSYLAKPMPASWLVVGARACGRERLSELQVACVGVAGGAPC